MKPTPPLLTPETAARLAQIDRELDLAAPSFAETILSAILNDIKEGNHGIILDGYEWEHGEQWASKRIAALVESWKDEDAPAQKPAIAPATIFTLAAKLAKQDAQERAERRAAICTLSEAANAQEDRE